MLPWVERVYGIPPEQVVGSSGITNFQVGSDGRPVLMKEPNIEIVNDGQQTGWHQSVYRQAANIGLW